jgi:N6-adenosine-specific RNA methylase IME4
LRNGSTLSQAWEFTYKTNLVWHKIRKDGGSDGRGVGFYFRNVTELVLFGVRGRLRTEPPARRQVNLLATRKREHSRKPDELYPLIEACSLGPRLELFARYPRQGWCVWGDEAAADVEPRAVRPIDDFASCMGSPSGDVRAAPLLSWARVWRAPR